MKVSHVPTSAPRQIITTSRSPRRCRNQSARRCILSSSSTDIIIYAWTFATRTGEDAYAVHRRIRGKSSERRNYQKEFEGHGIVLQVENDIEMCMGRRECDEGRKRGIIRQARLGTRGRPLVVTAVFLLSRQASRRPQAPLVPHQLCTAMYTPVVTSSTSTSFASSSSQASHATSPPPFLLEDFTTASPVIFPSPTSTTPSIATLTTSTPTTLPSLRQRRWRWRARSLVHLTLLGWGEWCS
jgi:hypothetical protein